MNGFLLLAETTLPVWTDEIVLLLIKIFGAALIGLAALAARKLGKKWGIEETHAGEERARGLARDAIAFADRWARNRDKGNASKPEGKDKLEMALDFAIDVDKAIGITEKARMAFARKIEAELEKSEGNKDAT